MPSNLSGRGGSTSRRRILARGTVGRAIAGLVVFGLSAGAPPAGAAGQEAAAGPFTAEQAAAGWATYARSCSECHGTDLRGSSHGPELTGSGFLNNWGVRTTAELLDYIRNDMPPGLGGSLGASAYLNIVAYLLEANGYEAGPQALEADAAVGIGTVRAGGGRAARARGDGDPPDDPEADDTPRGRRSGFVNREAPVLAPVTDGCSRIRRPRTG